MQVDDLSPVAQDYLKVIWSAVEWGEPPITTKAIAARLGTSQANVSETMRRLHAHGLVVHQPYRPVTLTPLGERLALGMVRRHRLLETFLAEVLGYGWEEVHADAERLEHAASDRFLERIDALLGRPRNDPHGDPIPTADGHWVAPTAVRLSEAGPGDYWVVRVSDADPDRLTRLRAQRLVPGAAICVAADGSVRPGSDGDILGFGVEDLSEVRVRRRH